MKISSEISAGFLDQAEQELFEIIFQQRDAFRTRWRANWLSRRGAPILRAIGIILSLLGIALCFYFLTQTLDGCPDPFHAMLFLPGFLFFLVLFNFLPTLDQHLQQKLGQFIIRSCKKQAAQCVQAARTCTPFIAEYEIKDQQISYYRCKENQATQVWTRKLKGVAIHRKLATIIYKKPNAFQPRIIILHTEFEPLAEALKEQGMEILP